ncbi:hypothetical protein ACNAW0_12665 [Micromonospora sp. SL1-18]|uniref:hypothetical protein n=1 Tax=Micromonospora sp. SL1-18 TaxID=3399128 RepID=UPI003A4E43FB
MPDCGVPYDVLAWTAEKLAYLRRLDAHTLDLSLQRREPERRYPILLTLLRRVSEVS